MFGQTDTAADPVSMLLDQVPLLIIGVFVGGIFIRGNVVPGRQYDALEAREELQRAEMAQLRKALEEKILPALIRAGSLTEQTISALDSTAKMLVDMNDALQSALAVLPQLQDGTASLDTVRELVATLDEFMARLESAPGEGAGLDQVNEVLERVITALQSWE